MTIRRNAKKLKNIKFNSKETKEIIIIKKRVEGKKRHNKANYIYVGRSDKRYDIVTIKVLRV